MKATEVKAALMRAQDDLAEKWLKAEADVQASIRSADHKFFDAIGKRSAIDEARLSLYSLQLELFGVAFASDESARWMHATRFRESS